MNGDGGDDHGGDQSGAHGGNRVLAGRFELLARLGSGGMGTVWRARDLDLDREVALKEVRSPDPELAAEAREIQRERALREARALARLSHPNVVTIHQILTVEGPEGGSEEDPGQGSGRGSAHPWLVMELLPGRTLQDRLDTGTLSPVEAATIGRQVLAALRAAHAAGVHHRDVKPANIMFRADGSAVLTDFGIAALHGSASLTRTGSLIGSPEYMAPERIRGTDNDPASDLWSLGLVLYAAVEGVSPLRRGTTLATLAAVLDDPVPPAIGAGTLAPVLAALLVRDPAARPDGARLDALLAQVETGRTPESALPTETAPPRQGPYPAAARPPGPRFTLGGWGGRDTTVSTAEADQRALRRLRLTLITAAAVVTAGVVATAVYLPLRGDDGGDGDPGRAGPTPTATATAPEAQPPDAPRQSPPEERPSPQTPSQDPNPNPRGPENTWVAQLTSVDKDEGESARQRHAAALRGKGVENVTYLDSDAYASLRPGYWVLYVPGFADGEAALDWCASKGLTSKNECVGRYVSKNPDDFRYQCLPPAQTPGNRCTRP